jgi:hypothetical protein
MTVFVADSVSAFVRRLAVNLVPNGYWFYVTGCIPAGKDAAAVDSKLIERYDLNQSKHVRYRRRLTGQASVAYVRFEREFILLATHGEHIFFEREAGQVHDLRRRPVRFHAYSISYRNEHASVRIHAQEFARLRVEVERGATRWTEQGQSEAIERLPYERYAPIRQQIRSLHRLATRQRRRAGLAQEEPLEPSS